MKRAHSLERRVASAVSHFWTTRQGQATKQEISGRRDQGGRGAVTGGKQMDGFVSIVRDLITDLGLPASCVHTDTSLELPGYFRPEKKWDLLVVDDGHLLAAFEFKSQIGPSFGNNFNNRSEEAIGTAHDIWTAYREGAFPIANRPWLGFLMMLEDCPASTSPVAVRQPHFPVFPEFVGASYSQRYQLLMNRIVRERHYDSACFLMSARETGASGRYTYPAADLTFSQMSASLTGRISTWLATKPRREK